MLAWTDLKDAFTDSAKSGMFESVRSSGGWMAKLEHEYETSYKATLWNDGHGLCIQHCFGARDNEKAAELAANYVRRYHDLELWPKKPSEKVRNWYLRTCPTDELGDCIDEDATFADYLVSLARCGDAYCYGIDDSVVRQRVMAATAHVMGMKYNDLYDLWRV